MYVPFEELSSESRVWVYQANRSFTIEEEVLVSQALKKFCEQWAAHGQALKSSYKIDRNQFVIMAVDEDFHNPSGCSIDSSVGVMRHIHQATGIDLLDRSKVPFILNGNIELIPVQDLKQHFQQGTLRADTQTLNTLIATKADLEKKWEIPVENSWLTKYLPKVSLTSQP